jgi:hypothetical protein
MAEIKRVLVCFNQENKSHHDLWQMCVQEFGVNLSGGIRSILWSYFNGSLRPQQIPPVENKEESPSMESVL